MKLGFILPGSYAALPADIAARFPDIEIVAGATPDEIAAALPGLDALVSSTLIYTEAFASRLAREAPRLRWLQVLSTGVDGILKAGVPPRVILTSATGVHANAVADHALALLLALMRKLPEALSYQAMGHWSRRHLENRAWALEGRRVLVPGFGTIGRALCRRLAAADAEVIAFNRQGGESGLEGVRLEPLSQLSALLPEADAIVLCLPGDDALRGLIGAAELAALPAHALIVNIGRGNLIDQTALATALASGSIGGAGLDVYEQEPLAEGDLFWGLPNLIATPHIGGVGGQNYQHFKALLEDNITRFCAGQPLRNAVPGTGDQSVSAFH